MRHLIMYMVLATAIFAIGEAQAQDPRSELSSSEERRRLRLFDEHVVRPGETAFSIARGYAISPLVLAEDNPGVDLTRLAGRTLLIRRRERGKTGPEQVTREWQQMLGVETAAPTGPGTTTRPDGTMTQAPMPTDGTQAPTQADGRWSTLGTSGPEAWQRRDNGTTAGRGSIPNIAIMLPLDTYRIANTAGSDFTDFYKGALLALEDLKAAGRSANVTLYNSGRSVEKMQSIVTSPEFVETDLIIGPVYEEEMSPAIQFGEFFGVPVVSPLAALRSVDSEVLYQMAPDPAAKYDKLLPLLEADRNVILISSGAGNDDEEFRREITAELGARNYGQFTIGGGDVASLIDWERENVLIVLAGSEGTVDRALATIASSYNNASARRSRRAAITVVGSSRWAGYGAAIDENLFFKLGVKFVTNYYINRLDKRVARFETRYTEAYGDFPTRASFRGYDTAALFAGALFENGASFADRLERVGSAPLGTGYRFVRKGDGIDRSVNDQWTLVSFINDYNITTQ